MFDIMARALPGSYGTVLVMTWMTHVSVDIPQGGPVVIWHELKV